VGAFGAPQSELGHIVPDSLLLSRGAKPSHLALTSTAFKCKNARFARERIGRAALKCKNARFARERIGRAALKCKTGCFALDN
jgi:hypothetical protein